MSLLSRFEKFFSANHPIILEAGAHDGSDTIKFAKKWPNATIYAFEPNPSNYLKLASVTNNYNVKTYQLGLSDKSDDRIKFYVDLQCDGGASSILKANEWFKRNHVPREEEIFIKTVNLDEFCQKEGINSFDLMWLDMEGFELIVLKGCPQILKNTRQIFIEINFMDARQGYPKYSEVAQFMGSVGFKEVYHESYNSNEPWGKWLGNALFVKSDIYSPSLNDFKLYIDEYSRYTTFKHCFDYITDLLSKEQEISIVELGSTKTFVDGKYPGCGSSDIRYWEPSDLQKWDWGTGMFLKIFTDSISSNKIKFTTVDIDSKFINMNQVMTTYDLRITYKISDSVNFLNICESLSFDLIYLNTGYVNPVEPTAQLQLTEAQIIVDKNLLKPNGLILINDVKNPSSGVKNGKAKYSIPYLQDHGFKIVLDDYQVILAKNV